MVGTFPGKVSRKFHMQTIQGKSVEIPGGKANGMEFLVRNFKTIWYTLLDFPLLEKFAIILFHSW